LIGFRRQILHVTDGTFEFEVFQFLIQEIKKNFHLWYLKVAVASMEHDYAWLIFLPSW
jgi:hypothetical protein